MILGLGSDIVENERIAKLYRHYGQRFLHRLFTLTEIDYALARKDPIPYLAARFAVKEAAIKALNLPGATGGISWQDIEICGKSFGKKTLALYNQAQKAANSLNATRYHISLSHSEHFSMAVVILEGASI